MIACQSRIAGSSTIWFIVSRDYSHYSSEGGTMKKSTYLTMAIAALLAGCARGGGIGLEAMVADGLCEQRGFRLGTSEYANCRAQIAHRHGMVNAEMQARLQRQQDYY